MAAPPDSVDELKWLGIDIVSTANNHCSDFGEGGVMTSLEYLDQFGMAHAGTGANLTEARAPGYLDTRKGRVALIAAADWGPRGSGGQPWPHPMGVMAGEQAPYSLGRPGCNLIRHHPRFSSA
jgi:poly-gamma-glutamate synthesis protein (capsule biosynthesis protein)